jgi:hypothetical protein
MNRSIATSFAVVLFWTMTFSIASYANPIWPGVFELADRPYSTTVPPNGSQWRALTMRGGPDGFEFTVVQALYVDGAVGAEVVNVGDVIYGPEAIWRERIVVVGTCRLYRLLETGWIVRAPDYYSGSPIGEIWETLRPSELWGSTHQVQDFVPWDVPPMRLPEAGDRVLLDGVWATIEWAHLGIDGDFAVPVEATTWGRIKALLRRNR